MVLVALRAWALSRSTSASRAKRTCPPRSWISSARGRPRCSSAQLQMQAQCLSDSSHRDSDFVSWHRALTAKAVSLRLVRKSCTA